MKILLTGDKGFIGQNLYKELHRRNHEIYALDKEDSGIEELKKIIFNSQAVLHQGAISDTMNHNVNEMMQYNFQSSKIIFDIAHEADVKVIYASSAASYGTSSMPTNLYGWSKYLAEQYGLALFNNKPNKFIALRYFNVYGPGESHKGKMASVAYQSFKKKNMKLFPKMPRRDFVFIKDIISANLFALENDIANGAYDVGSGTPEPFEKILDLLGVPFIYHDESAIPEGYQFYTCSDPNKWMPGWKPQYDLDKGIEEYREYLVEPQYDNHDST